MAYSNFSRKQAGVIYRAIKEGDIIVDNEFVKMMYNRADARINHDVVLDDVEAKLRNAVNFLFNGQIAEAQIEVDLANDVYNGHFMSNEAYEKMVLARLEREDQLRAEMC